MKRHIAAVMTVGIVLFFLVSIVSDAQPMKRPGWCQGPNLKEALELTPEQEAKLQEFRKARQAEGQAFREKMQKLRTNLGELMKDPKADQKKIDGLIDEMSKFEADRFKAAFRNRNEWRKLFTPDQLKKIDDFRGGLMKGMDQRPGMWFGPGRFMGRGGFGQGFAGPMGFGRHGFSGPGFMQRPGMMRNQGWKKRMRWHW